MKKLTYILLFLCLGTIYTSAQNFDLLWKQLKVAERNDAPKTQLALLKQIEQKALTAHRYGDALLVQWKSVQVYDNLSLDSVEVYLKQINHKAENYKNKDVVLYSLHHALLAQAYRFYAYELNNARDLEQQHWDKAFLNVNVLGQTNSLKYAPFIEKGADGVVFNNDLLHVLGFSALRFNVLYNYYNQQKNKSACCIVEAKQLDNMANEEYTQRGLNRYLAKADSLLAAYGEIAEGVELAIVRCNIAKRISGVKDEDLLLFINNALNKWGKQARANVLREEKAQILLPVLDVKLENTVLRPNEQMLLDASQCRNIEKITVKIWSLKTQGTFSADVETSEGIAKAKRLISDKWSKELTMFSPTSPFFKYFSNPRLFSSLEKGVYLIELNANKKDIKPAYKLVYVTNVAFIAQNLPNNKVRVAVVNATTGEGIPYATLNIKRNNYVSNVEKKSTVKCEQDGTCLLTVNNTETIEVQPVGDGDAFAPYSPINYYYYNDNGVKNTEYTSVFTDRKVYKPGQKVQVSVLNYTLLDTPNIMPNEGKTLEVVLRDANYKEVAKQTITTNKYGSAGTSFTLPTSALTGLFYIKVGNASYSFRVENYKLPTYEVNVLPTEAKNTTHREASVKGVAKSFAGFAMPNVRIIATTQLIQRNKDWWWNRQKTTLATHVDTLYTDVNGAFNVSMPNEWTKKIEDTNEFYYVCKFHLQALSASGESHEVEKTVALGNQSNHLSALIPHPVEQKKHIQTYIQYVDAAEEPINTELNYCFDNDKKWNKVASNVDVTLLTNHLSTGKHTLSIVCNKDTLTQSFVVFNLKDKTMPIDSVAWFYQSNSVISEKNPVSYIQIGTSNTNQQVFYTITHGNKVFKHGVKTLNNEVITEEFTANDVPNDGMEVAYAWIRDGKLYYYRAIISKALPEKKLNVSWKTFRNKLAPNSKETWSLCITDAQNKPKQASLLAVLYDKTLDAISANAFSFAPKMPLYYPSLNCSMSSKPSAYFAGEGILDVKEAPVFSPNVIASADEPPFYGYTLSKEAPITRGLNKRNNTRGEGNIRLTAYKKNIPPETDATPIESYNTTKKAENTQANNAKRQWLRENLQETAFFYPHLETSKDGIATLQFTLPESITTWKFMAMAHDEQLNYGFLDTLVVASKALIIQPNVPRFLRKTDKATLSAMLFNRTEQTEKAVAKLEIIDPQTQKVLFVQSCKCAVEAQQTKGVSFNFNTSNLPQLVIARFSVVGKNVEDGEQHYISILSDVEKVVNVRSFVQHKPEKLSLSVDKLFPNDATNKQLTLEYTQNPVWLQLNTLPTMASENATNALQVVTSYYANNKMINLLQSIPNIDMVLQVWRDEALKNKQLNSSLAQNDDLKLSSLFETPWVSVAEKEDEQTKNILRKDLISQLVSRKETDFQKLQTLQYANGAFSWFPNMPSSAYITCVVLEKMAILFAQEKQSPALHRLLNKALQFMEKEVKNEVESIKKQQTKGVKSVFVSDMAMRYLYAKTLLQNEEQVKWNENDTFLLNTLSTLSTSSSIYEKAKVALLLFKNKHRNSEYTSKATTWLNSLKEYSVFNADKGRYFDTYKAGYNWIDNRVLTQISAIEALKEITPEDTTTIEEMQRWLVMNRQTQRYYDELVGIETAHALSTDSKSNAFKLEPFNTQFFINNTPWVIDSSSKVLGYVNQTEKVNNVSSVVINKQSKGTSWGALYATFEQPIDKIKQEQNGFTLTRTLWKEGKEVSEKNLKVGDKITIKLTLVADNNYHFVEISDERASCFEPVSAISGYRNGAYCAVNNTKTHFFFNSINKGTHVITFDYYIDKAGTYTLAPCKVQCAYAPSFAARTSAQVVTVAP